MTYATTATISTPINTQFSIVARLVGMFESFKLQQKRNRAFRQTVGELNTLSNRRLRDLGISRHDIRRVAYDSSQLIR